MAILPRPAPTRAGIPRPVEVTGRLRVTKIAPIPGAGRSRILLDPPRPASTIITKLPLGILHFTLTIFSAQIPSPSPSRRLRFFFCPASLTPPPTNLPYTVPHAASHQPPSRSSSLIHAAAAPRSVTPQILSVTPQILAQSRRRSSLSHATDQQILAQSRRSSAL